MLANVEMEMFVPRWSLLLELRICASEIVVQPEEIEMGRVFMERETETHFWNIDFGWHCGKSGTTKWHPLEGKALREEVETLLRDSMKFSRLMAEHTAT